MGRRKRADSNEPSDLQAQNERLIYNVITSKRDMGIWTGDIKRELKKNLPAQIITKSTKSLLDKNLIKLVANVQKRGKHLMGVEFEPSKEISGGVWYSDGELNKELITVVKRVCVKQIMKMKVATLEGILEFIERSRVVKVELTEEEIEEIVKVLVLENEIMEVRSNGSGEFKNIPVGKVCYKKNICSKTPPAPCFASIPCGACPNLNVCSPDGLISPKTCVYHTKWLDF